MKAASESPGPGRQRSIRVLVASNYIPQAGVSGTYSLMLDFLQYLSEAGFIVEFAAMDSVPGGWVPWCRNPFYGRLGIRMRARRNVCLGPWMISLDLQALTARVLSGLLKKRPSWKLLIEPLLKSTGGVRGWCALPGSVEREYAGRLLAGLQPCVLVADYAWMADLFDLLPAGSPVIRVLMTHDLLHQRSRDFESRGYAADLGKWDRAKEAALLAKAAILLVELKEQMEEFRAMAPGSEVLHVTMSGSLRTVAGSEKTGRCLFVGGTAAHNYYGMQWFLSKVWPEVRKAMPDAVLHICGDVCRQLRYIPSGSKLLGRLKNLDAQYAEASVVVVPLLVGSGFKIKLLEALQHGKAIVATPAGAQGAEELSGKALDIAETAVDFTDAVLRILQDPGKRKSMEMSARIYAMERMGSDVVYGPFVRSILKRRPDLSL